MNRTPRKHFSAAMLALALSCITWTASARVDVAEARRLAGEALKAYDAGDYRTAADKLATAYEVVRVPTLALYRARALEKLGDWVAAVELYQEATELEILEQAKAGVQEQAQREAAAARARLLPRIPRIIVQVDGAEPGEIDVMIDDQTIRGSELGEGRLLNPGGHVVIGTKGDAKRTESVSLEEGDTKTVVLDFAPEKPTPMKQDTLPVTPEDDGTRRTLGWIGIGVGGAGLAAGGITLAMLLSKKSELEAGDCVDQVCGPTAHDDVESYNSLRPISTAAFIIGAAAAGTGAYLLWGSDSDEPAQDEAGPSISAWASVGSVEIRGRF